MPASALQGGRNLKFRCAACGHSFLVMKKDGTQVTSAARAAAPKPSGYRVDLGGEVRDLPDLAALQQLVAREELPAGAAVTGPDGQIRAAADVPELSIFFDLVHRATRPVETVPPIDSDEVVFLSGEAPSGPADSLEPPVSDAAPVDDEPSPFASTTLVPENAGADEPAPDAVPEVDPDEATAPAGARTDAGDTWAASDDTALPGQDLSWLDEVAATPGGDAPSDAAPGLWDDVESMGQPAALDELGPSTDDDWLAADPPAPAPQPAAAEPAEPPVPAQDLSWLDEVASGDVDHPPEPSAGELQDLSWLDAPDPAAVTPSGGTSEDAGADWDADLSWLDPGAASADPPSGPTPPAPAPDVADSGAWDADLSWLDDPAIDAAADGAAPALGGGDSDVPWDESPSGESGAYDDLPDDIRALAEGLAVPAMPGEAGGADAGWGAGGMSGIDLAALDGEADAQTEQFDPFSAVRLGEDAGDAGLVFGSSLDSDVLDFGPSPGADDDPEPDAGGGGKMWIAIAVVLILGAGGWWWWSQQQTVAPADAPAPAPAPAAAAPAPAPAPPSAAPPVGEAPAGEEPLPGDAQPAGSQPAGSQPAGSQPAGSQPSGSEPAAAPPAPAPAPAPAAAPAAAPKKPAPKRSRGVKAIVDRGWSHVDRNRLADAAASFNQAIQASPTSGEAHFGAGYVAERQGNLTDAFREYCLAQYHAGKDTSLQREIAGRLRAIGQSCQ